MLLQAGADPNSRWVDGPTPLMMAVETGNQAKVEALLAAGAEVNVMSGSGRTACWLAALHDKSEVLALLLRHGADPELSPPARSLDRGSGKTPLQIAAEMGHQEAVRTLLEAGANPNRRGGWGWTPLMSAADARIEEVVALLLAFGADPDMRDNDEHTAAEVDAAEADRRGCSRKAAVFG